MKRLVLSIILLFTIIVVFPLVTDFIMGAINGKSSTNGDMESDTTIVQPQRLSLEDTIDHIKYLELSSDVKDV